jgi:hypothetical protein
MIEAVLVMCLLMILSILFWPRRSPFRRRITRSYNGQHRGKEQELY